MAGFKFDEVDQFLQDGDNRINFLKLQDDGCYAKVRFMYGPGEVFEGQTVHNVSEDPSKPRYVCCLRETGQPLEACPLCQNGAKLNAQYFIPVYVMSIVTNVRGVTQEEPVNQVMIFQRGTTFKGALQSVIRQSKGTCLANNVFNLVRNGKARDVNTTYSVELIGTDTVGLESLPERPQVVGSYILPKHTAQEMIDKCINKTAAPAETVNTGIVPRTLNANTFAGNEIVSAAPAAMATQVGATASVGASQASSDIPF